MRLLSIFAALVATISLARAEVPAIEFGGERYELNFEDQATSEDGAPGEGLAEFTLPGETVEDWTKLFAYHAYPEMGDDPMAAVQMVGKVVIENNKDANFAIVENAKTGAAIIDFLTWTPESDVMAFNVFRYARASSGKGLIAMQYAQHIRLGDIDVAGMQALRARSIADMAALAITPAQDYFARKQGKSASNAEDDGQPTLARAGGDN